MLNYNRNLKQNARKLRTEMTDSEQILWSRLRKKQIQGIQFYRQKVIGNYIVDFYAPKATLVVEADGSQHMETPNFQNDVRRDLYLKSCGLQVLRFNNLQILQELEDVIEVIFRVVRERMGGKNPP